MSARSWTMAEAKAKFSEVIERAISEGPQTITRKGRTAALVVGAEEWQRKTRRAGNWPSSSRDRRCGAKG